MAVNGGKLDDAARAAWLYYVGGNTQDQIAAKLGVSRQSAQRLVSLAVSENLVKVRIDHPIAKCLDLSMRLRETYSLSFCEVVPTDPDSISTTLGIAQATAAEISNWLKRTDPITMAIGTGRTLRAAVEQLSTIECPQHRVVSLTGNIAPDGSAAYYNVVFTMADKVKARFFPMPLPVIASSESERAALHDQPMIRNTLKLAEQADVTFVGIGELDDQAPLYVDGFISQEDLDALRKSGAVTEIVGWTFDAAGQLVQGITNERVASAPLPSAKSSLVIASAMGSRKLPGIRIAVTEGIVNGLITDEATAEALVG